MQSRRAAKRHEGSAGLDRRPPAGIARERETSVDDTAPCQREFRAVS